MSTLQIQKIHPHATIPTRAHEGDAGLDLYAEELAGTGPIVIRPGEQQLIGTGIAIALPVGTVGLVCPRSGLATKHGVTVANAPGIVDEGYRGEVKVALVNHGTEPFIVEPGMRIAQLVITPYLAPAIEEVDVLDETARGAGGFGSSGR